MVDTLPNAHELDAKEKKNLLKKARKLSRVFGEEVNKIDGSSGTSFLSRSLSSASAPTRSGLSLEPSTGISQEVGDFMGTVAENTMRRSSSISGHSLLSTNTTEYHSTSYETDNQSTPLTSPAAKTPKPTRQVGENIPPHLDPQSAQGLLARRRESIDLGSLRSKASSDLKRSRSLWTHRQTRQGDSADTAAEFQDRYARNFGTGTMTERQRALNVKRARKMAQLFGQEPPSELIQIHDERESDHSRDSTTTLSAYLTVTPSPLPRDRSNSTSSSGSVPKEGVEVNDEPPPTPPPFSTVREMAPTSPVSAKSFQERRRRAAKLSRFFGVGFQDIALSPDVLPPVPDTPIDVDVVDVKVSGRRFWSFSERSKDADMQKAIQKLRGLKAG